MVSYHSVASATSILDWRLTRFGKELLISNRLRFLRNYFLPVVLLVLLEDHGGYSVGKHAKINLCFMIALQISHQIAILNLNYFKLLVRWILIINISSTCKQKYKLKIIEICHKNKFQVALPFSRSMAI